MRFVLKPRLNYSSPISTIGLIKTIFSNKIKHPLSEKLFPGKEVFFTNHARTGIRLILSSLNLPVKAKVGVMAYNCHTVFKSIAEAGMEPIFIDINSDFKIDKNDLFKKKNRIDALIITHLFGIPSDMNTIKEIYTNGPIIEDCAHGFFPMSGNKMVGYQGDAVVYSMGKGKFPSIGDGGVVVLNHTKLLDKFKRLFNNLPKNTNSNFILFIKNIILSILHNPFIYAILTQPFLKKIDSSKDLNKKFVHAESKIATYNKLLFEKLNLNFIIQLVQKFRNNGLNNINIIKTRYFDDIIRIPDIPSTSNYFMVPLLVKNPDDLIDLYRKQGIELGRHFSNAITWAGEFGYKSHECPNAEYIAKHVLTLPTHYKFFKA